jgi:NAD(P)H-flavin reductase
MATAPQTEQPVAAPPAPFRIAARRRETRDTWTLRLDPLSSAPIAARPGQFTMLHAFGVGEVRIQRH